MPRIINIFAVLLLCSSAQALAASERIAWQAWNDASFAQAQKQNKPLYLYLEAVWCHWCHVMQEKTFSDPAVIKTLNSQFIPVKVDHDAMPALANRYRAWGWPAQIWFAAGGGELAKRSGYIAPGEFLTLLENIRENPEPGRFDADENTPAASGSAILPQALREQLRRKHLRAHDSKNGGLKLAQKFLDPDSVEYDLHLAQAGDEQAHARAVQTLDGALALIDPVWGGAYQYSTHGVWSKPHYEKIMRTQAAYLRIYSLAYRQTRDPDYRVAAQAVAGYLSQFWQSPAGGFYTSQDADVVRGEKAHAYFDLDDAGRRQAGMPRIDRNRYAQENGWAIEGLFQLYAATGDMQALTMARGALSWTIENRRQARGSFRHGSGANEVGYLGDNLAMARALLECYRVTGTRDCLAQSRLTADFVAENFQHESGGFLGAGAAPGPLQPALDIDENIAAVRYFNLLAHYSGEPRYRQLAEHGMRYLTRSDVAIRRVDEAGILLADAELARDPLHITVTGPKQDPAATALYKTALTVPGWYNRIEWWDRSEGQLPNHDVEYPDLGRPAGFLCEAQRCSLPQFNAAALEALLEQRGR